jgi:hypothetical protein
VNHLTRQIDDGRGVNVSQPRSKVTHLEGSERLSKREQLRTLSHRRWTLGIVLTCTSIWWSSGGARAQSAAPDTMAIAAPSSLWSLEEPGQRTEPHLVIGIVEREGSLLYDSSPLAGRRAIDPAAENTTPRQTDESIFANSSKEIASSPVVLSNLSDSTLSIEGITNLRSKPTSSRKTVQRTSDPNGAQAGGLLGDASDAGPFLAGDRMRDVLSTQRSEEDESFASEATNDRAPLAQFQLGGWQLPVALTNRATSQ